LSYTKLADHSASRLGQARQSCKSFRQDHGINPTGYSISDISWRIAL